jgi:hypothetical protein
MISLSGYNIPSEIIDLICSNCCDLTKFMMARANKQFKILFGKIALRGTYLRGTYICKEAAFNGSLGILKWTRKNGCEWDSKTCSNAAKNGHLEILKWVRENGCDWNNFTCCNAAENGYLEILKWARENDCDSFTCAAAAESGNLEILKWAH